MSKFARIEKGIALEVFSVPDGFSIDECFHPDVAIKFAPCPSDVTTGSSVEDGVWKIHTPEPVVDEIIHPKILATNFQLLFTLAEIAKVHELRESDAAIAAFWKLVDDPRTNEIDLNLSIVQNAILHTLSAVKEAGVDVNVISRNEEILTGIVR